MGEEAIVIVLYLFLNPARVKPPGLLPGHRRKSAQTSPTIGGFLPLLPPLRIKDSHTPTEPLKDSRDAHRFGQIENFSRGQKV